MAKPSVSRLVAFLGIEPTERRSVGLMTAHSFFMGCATVFFETAASATFLSRFPSTYIPWVYVAAAAVNTLTGTMYAKAQERLSFAGLMKATLWALFIVVMAVRLGFALSDVAWVAFLGLVSYRMISSLTDLEYWAVASCIYDVRQAKRLFGLIGTGEVTARIVGSFSVPILVGVIGVQNLMLVSATGLGLCLWMLTLVLRPLPNLDRSAKLVGCSPAPEESRAGLQEITASPYLALVAGVAVLATFGKYFVDFAFLEQVGTVSKVEAHLATVLGLFNGITQTLSLLIRLFVSRPLLGRYGIRWGVLVLPSMHAACALATCVAGVIGAGHEIVFWLVIANQGLYKTLKHPIDNASFKVLYQPIRPGQRLAVQIAVEVIFSPVVVGLAGAVMLLFTVAMPYDPARFSVVLLGTFAAWAVTAAAAGRGYQRRLLEMLRGRPSGDGAVVFDDATSLSVLRSRLDSPAPAQVCAALDLLEKTGAPGMTDVLIARLNHGSPEVRRYVVHRLLELDPNTLQSIRSRISLDPDPSVRRAGVDVVAAGPEDLALHELTAYFNDEDLSVRRAAVTALFRLGHDEALQIGREAVTTMARSSRGEERVLAARLAGEHRLLELTQTLAADRDLEVRRAALQAAGRSGDRRMVELLIDHLLDPRFAQTAAVALASRGQAALEALGPKLHHGTNDVLLRRIIYVCRLVGVPAIPELQRHIGFPAAMIRGRVLAALDALGYRTLDADRPLLRELVEGEAASIAWMLATRRDLAREVDLEMLRHAMTEEISEARQRVIALLSFGHDRTAVRRATDVLASGSKEARSYAHEVLELSMDREERALVMPLFDTDEGRQMHALERVFPQQSLTANHRLRHIIDRSEMWISDWTRSLAIHLAWKRAVDTNVERWMLSTDGVLRETATNASAGDRRTDTIPPRTTMLLIEKILILKTVHIFARASEELLAEIAAILEEVEVPRGRLIVEKGAAGDSMYIVVHGRVRVFDGPTTLCDLGETEIFGELALLDPEPRSASVEATEDAVLFRLDGDMFSQLMAGNLEIVRGVLHVLCERLRRTSAAAGRV